MCNLPLIQNPSMFTISKCIFLTYSFNLHIYHARLYTCMCVTARACEHLHLCVYTSTHMNYIFFKPMNRTVTLIILCFIFHSQLITIADVGLVEGLAVDPGAGKLYFSIYHEGKIEVVNLNGSGRQTFLSHAASSVAIGIALDLTDG